jgi:hypothetical protein
MIKQLGHSKTIGLHITHELKGEVVQERDRSHAIRRPRLVPGRSRAGILHLDQPLRRVPTRHARRAGCSYCLPLATSSSRGGFLSIIGATRPECSNGNRVRDAPLVLNPNIQLVQPVGMSLGYKDIPIPH